MRLIVATSAVLSIALVSSAFAAPPKHRVPARQAAAPAYTDAFASVYARQPSNVVMFGNRIVGEDPDVGIRTQLLYDAALADN
jgi:hypothetical protein